MATYRWWSTRRPTLPATHAHALPFRLLDTSHIGSFLLHPNLPSRDRRVGCRRLWRCLIGCGGWGGGGAVGEEHRFFDFFDHHLLDPHHAGRLGHGRRGGPVLQCTPDKTKSTGNASDIGHGNHTVTDDTPTAPGSC
jgi:hypothetical protein